MRSPPELAERWAANTGVLQEGVGGTPRVPPEVNVLVKGVVTGFRPWRGRG